MTLFLEENATSRAEPQRSQRSIVKAESRQMLLALTEPTTILAMNEQ